MRALRVAVFIAGVVIVIQLVRLIVFIVTSVRRWIDQRAREANEAVIDLWRAVGPFVTTIGAVAMAVGLAWAIHRLSAAVLTQRQRQRQYAQWLTSMTRRVVDAAAVGTYTVSDSTPPPPPAWFSRPARRRQGTSSRFARPADPHLSTPPSSAHSSQGSIGSEDRWSGGLYAGGLPPVRKPAIRRVEPRQIELAGLGTRPLIERIASLVDEVSPIRYEPRPGPAARAAGEIEVAGVDGLQIGSHNTQDNFYVWVLRTPPIDLAERLNQADVQSTVAALAADPTNDAARQELIRTLAPGGWPLGGGSTEVQVAVLRPGRTSSGSPLLGTAFLRGVRGLQVADHSVQQNTFTYAVTPTVKAADLLQNNQKLARLLVACAFPEAGSGSTGALNAELRHALSQAEIIPTDGTARSVRADLPGPGRVLKLRDIDGASVGPGSTVHRHDRTVARHVRVDGISVYSRTRRVDYEDLDAPADQRNPPSIPRPRDGRGGGPSLF